jgi:multidrug efflux pump
VLAIGIVVDDAIVVVENVERNIERRPEPARRHREGHARGLGPIIAIALVLCAVFVPLAFVPGLTGQFYKQFAVTIAISTVISAFNSLTLSPALARCCCARTTRRRTAHTRHGPCVRRLLPLVQPRLPPRSEGYGRRGRLVRRKSWSAGGLRRAAGATGLLFARMPAGFVPAPDKQYLIGIAQLPAGASHRPHRRRDPRDERHRAEGAGHRRLGGLPGPVDRRLLGGAQRGHRLLRPGRLRERNARAEQGRHPGRRERRHPADPGRAHVRGAAAAVDGLGNAGGFKLQVQDRGGLGEQALYGAVWGTLGQVYGNPKSAIGTPFSTYDINVPQLYANVDRTKRQADGHQRWATSTTPCR